MPRTKEIVKEWRQYRDLKPGELIIPFGDCAQGGNDYNACQFYSSTYRDFPLVYEKQGVASTMTDSLYPVLATIKQITNVMTILAYERQMGGASELERLRIMNKGIYQLFVMPKLGNEEKEYTGKLGWHTGSDTRDAMLGHLKDNIDNRGVMIYDKRSIDQLYKFVISKRGKAEAKRGFNDDLVVSMAGCLQVDLYKQVLPGDVFDNLEQPTWAIKRPTWSQG